MVIATALALVGTGSGTFVVGLMRFTVARHEAAWQHDNAPVVQQLTDAERAEGYTAWTSTADGSVAGTEAIEFVIGGTPHPPPPTLPPAQAAAE